MNKLNIRNIKPSEINKVAALIAKGYNDDIFFEWVVNSSTDRLKIVTEYYKVYLKAEGAVVHVVEEASGKIIGASVWLPHNIDGDIYKKINKAAGKYYTNFQAVADYSHDNEPKDKPFYQLVGFVIDKEFRCCGLGKRLLKFQLDSLDKKGIGTYLEASTPFSDKSVYASFGYAPYGNIKKFTHTAVLYPLWRDADKNWLENFVKDNGAAFPIIGQKAKSPPIEIPLGDDSEYGEIVEKKEQRELNEFLFNLLKQENAEWALSGDREFRKALYRHADDEWVSQGLTVHVGVDIIVDKGTSVHAPYDGTITHVLYEDCLGGYGYIIALKVADFYLLFGHLSKDNLPKVGQKVTKGEQIGAVGDFKDNGGWFYHLHFQAMTQEGIDNNLIYEALFSPLDMAKADRISPSVMPLLLMSDK